VKATAATSVLMWAQRICAKRASPPHELLELRADATIQEIQDAFHKIARMAHPDVHRNSLAADELEMVTTAYALVAGAYQELRNRPGGPATTGSIPVARPRIPTPPGSAPVASEPASVPVTPSGAAPHATGPQALSSRAAVYYRKAELALKRGDLKSAVLQLKLAIAADNSSAFLRTALAEVEAELKKG
jgi:hypothetical protein